MAKANLTILSMNGGEVDAKTLARADLDIYSRVSETMENIFPSTQGGMSKVPGSEYIDDITALANITEEDGDVILDEAGDEVLTEGDSLGILRPFVRSDTVAYVLELSANQLRFLDNTTKDYVSLTGADATLAAWSDESAAPSSGGGAPIDPGTSDVTDPFYVDGDYFWINSEGGNQP